MDLAMALAAERDVDLVVANDPDADRCAAAVPDAARVADAARRRGRRAARPPPARARASRAPTRARSSPRRCSARSRPRPASRTSRRSPASSGSAGSTGLAFGYEEALGYCVDPEHVKDKDGVSALLLLCELAAIEKARGPHPDRRARRHRGRARPARHRPAVGAGQRPVADRRGDGPAADVAARPRSAAWPSRPSTTCRSGSAALPPTEGLRYHLAEGARVIVRPSGTEPKLKCYLEVVVPVHPDDGVDAARISAAGRLDALRADIKQPPASEARVVSRTPAPVAAQRRRVESAGERATASPTARSTSDQAGDLAATARLVPHRRQVGVALPPAGAVGQGQDPVADVVGIADLQLPVPRDPGTDGAHERVPDRGRDVALLLGPHRQHLAHGHLLDRGQRDHVGVEHVAQHQRALLDADRGPQQGGRTTRSRRTPHPRRPAPRAVLAVDDRAAPSRQRTAAPRARPSRGRWSAGTSRCSRHRSPGRRRDLVSAHHSPIPDSPVVPTQPYAGRMTSTSTTVTAAGSRLLRRHRFRRRAAPLPARPARRRPGRRRGPRRGARHPLDQDHRQGVRHRPGHPDGRPDDPRGRRTPPARCARSRAKAMHPDPADPTCPATAAVCVYPDMVATAKERLGSSGVNVAAVATAFPSGRAALDIKLADTRDAVEAGADEIDMVIDRGAFLAGPLPAGVRRDRRGPRGLRREDSAHLKVIFETGELQTYDNVRRASWLAMIAGGHFIKTSTGKVQPAATLPGHPGHARGRPRLPRADRHRWSASSPPAASGPQGRDQVPRDGQRGRRRPTGSTPTGSASAPPRCSTTC